jgi:hypothetical protein
MLLNGSRLQTEAHFQALIYSRQRLFIQMPYVFAQAGTVNGSYLFQKDDGTASQSIPAAIQENMSGQRMLVCSACDGGNDNSGAVAVSDIVLND